MQYTVQNIILPNDKVCHETRMYYRSKGALEQVKNVLFMEKNSTCDFSTYFNSFSLAKWLKYTALNNLSLVLCLQGKFKIEIYNAAWYKGRAITECQGIYYIEALKNQEYRFPFNLTNKENLYFTVTALSETAVFYGGRYETEIETGKLNPVDIDLVMCTFKREPYVKRNINLIIHDYIQNPNYNGAAHLHLKVVDNGQTLSAEEIEIPGLVKLYPNLNVGGSGGFCRGMMESLYEGKATHILFMDDDVLVQVEAFERTYNLLTLLKDEYRKTFIGGAMFRLDQKNMQHENLAGFKGNHLVGLKQSLNLNHFRNVLYNEKTEPIQNIYAAWWFCCIPVTIASLDNLPYPFFIRMDDIEYSIRNIKEAISLNGISVWHEAFDKKYSALMENYFMFRNNLVTNMNHHIGNRLFAVKFFARRFLHDIFRYDYGGAELLLDGVTRVLEGPEFFKEVDTVKDLQEHGKKQLKLQSMDGQEQDLLYQDFKHDINLIEESFFHKIVRFFTWNGHFLPNFFFKPIGFAEYGYGNNSKMYFARKKVFACDPNFETVAELTIDRQRCIQLIFRWSRLMLALWKKYNKLAKEYQQAMPEMTGEKFWRTYLKL